MITPMLHMSTDFFDDDEGGDSDEIHKRGEESKEREKSGELGKGRKGAIINATGGAMYGGEW